MNRRIFLSFYLLLTAFSHVAQAAEPAETRKPPPKNVLTDFLTFPFETAEGIDSALQGKIFNLGEIKVTHSRLSTRHSDETATQLPYNITVTGEREIKESGTSSVPELLYQREGVTYSDDTGLGLSARLDLRGFGGEGKQNLVLLDGLRAIEPFDNSTTWHLYPSDYLESIEIQRGGGSTIYGEGALSGIVRLKTKEPTRDLRIAADNSYGSYRSQKNFVEASGTTRGVGFYSGARYAVTDGYRQNSDHEAADTLLKLKYELSDLVAVENLLYFADHETGIPGPLSEAEANQDPRQKDPDGKFADQFLDKLVQDGLLVTYWAEPAGIEISNLIGYRQRVQDSFQTFGGSFPGNATNELETETFSNVLQGAWRREGERLSSAVTAGIEWSKDDVYNPFSSLDFGSGFLFSSERAIDRRSVGGFFQHHIVLWDRFIFEAGLRWDRLDWDIYDLKSPKLQKRKKADDLSPKVGIEYRLFDALSAYASTSESFKAPDSNTLIFETPNIFRPNPNIDSQKPRHREIGLRYAHPVFGSLRADFFYIETKKEILFNDIANINENFDTIRQGFELANEIALNDRTQFFFNVTYTDPEFDNGAFGGKTIPLVPETKWSLGTVAGPYRGWTASAQATGVYGQFPLNDFNNIFPVNDYWTTAAKLSCRQGKWEWYLKGQNLLDEAYSTFMTSDGVTLFNFNPAPGRNFELGCRLEF